MTQQPPLHQPSSLYDMSLNRVIRGLSSKSSMLKDALFAQLPQSISRDFDRRATLCSVCGKYHVERTFLIVRTTQETTCYESRICKSCVSIVQYECWACKERIDVSRYLEFEEKFVSQSHLYEMPALMTHYSDQRMPHRYLTLCHRCDGFFWPCDYCGAWINEN